VVIKPVPSGATVAGNPAKVIRNGETLSAIGLVLIVIKDMMKDKIREVIKHE